MPTIDPPPDDPPPDDPPPDDPPPAARAKRDWLLLTTTIVALISTVLSVAFTAVSLHYTADANRTTRDELHLGSQGQIADRFGKAIDQLGQEGPDKLDIRLGGIYQLSWIMGESISHEPAVIDVLCAFIRIHAKGDDPTTEVVEGEDPAIDIQSALDVLRRRPHPDTTTNQHIDLSRAHLDNTHLEGALLATANLDEANLVEAHLEGANLNGAQLARATLLRTYFAGATLTGANLKGADLNDSRDLTNEQIRCTWVDADTKLPGSITRRPIANAPEKDPACKGKR